MYILQWDEKYAVGIASIDSDHRDLFEVYNELYGSFLRGESNSMTAEKMELLAQFTRSHFAEEERLMEETGYPRLEEHRASHRLLDEQVNAMMEAMRRGEAVMNVPALKFLSEWITGHTLQEDRAYVPWVQQNAGA